MILGLQLPFAVIPLVMFTSDRVRMRAHVAPRWLTALGWLFAVTIVALNVKLAIDYFAR